MEFHRLAYPLFLLVVFAATWAVRGSARARNVVLAAASYAFYAYADARFVALLAAVTAVAYFGAPWVAPSRPGARKARLAALLAVVLSGLVVLKYWDFVARAVNSLAGAAAAGGPLPVLEVAAAAGVSFYTFQAIGYLVDVYRGDVEPERDPLALALFVGFFPQILAGPIGRAGALLPQWRAAPPYDDRRVSSGLFLILSGAAKKVLIGDFLATRLVNPAFAYPDGIGALGALAAIYGFAFQVYGDFAGYSEMAIGSARCLGVDLPINFNAPYRARNVSDLWKRWHISLSTWIRDYLFLPMCGRSSSPSRAYVAAVVSMALCGLWHGASAAWIAWGTLHGVALVVHQAFAASMRRRFALKKKLDASTPFRIASIALTFHFACATLLLVRGADPAMNPGAASATAPLTSILRELASAPAGDGAFFLNVWTVGALAAAAGTHAMPSAWKLALARGWTRVPRPAQGAALVVSALALFVVRPDAAPFLYFRF